MATGIIDSVLLFFAIFLTALYGMTFRFARSSIYGRWRDGYTTLCDFASSASLFLYVGAAIMLAIAFTWWVPIVILFLGNRAAVEVARRGETMLLLMLGKFFILAGYILLSVAIARMAFQLAR